jgi:hypothetical protein
LLLVTLLAHEIASAKQAQLRETARLDRCCGRGALRRIAKTRRIAG